MKETDAKFFSNHMFKSLKSLLFEIVTSFFYMLVMGITRHLVSMLSYRIGLFDY